MATASENTIKISAPIRSRLARLRKLIRTYVLVQGLAAVLTCIAVCFWISLAIDYLFEPPRTVRLVILTLLALAVLVVLFRSLLSRLFVPLTDKNMAVLLERRHRKLDDRLLTVVELSRRPSDQGGYDPRMLASTRDELDQLIPATDVASVFRAAPLGNALLLASVLVGLTAVFGAWQQSAVKIWFDRSLMLGESQWPRATSIEVEGFPEEAGRRSVKVARGSDLKVRAKANTKFAIPDAIQIRYETVDASGRPNMTKLKRAVPGRDPYQFYEYEFKNIQATIDFDVVAQHGGLLGKNDRVEDLTIEAVESPDFSDITLACKYPDYLARELEEFSVRVIRPLPEGAEVTLHATANKDLVAASYRSSLDNPDAPWEPITLDKQKPREVTLALGALAADTRIEFELHDVDGVTNQQPIRLLLRIVPDEAPRVDVRLTGVGKAVTPLADLPVRGTIWDDHGISSAWFDYSVDGGDTAKRSFDVPSNGELDQQEDVIFEMLDLRLQPGQQIGLFIKAADNYALAGEPHVGVGQRYDLQVVSEAELRAMLETRERLLRRRFESVIAEVQRSRDSLSRMLDQPGGNTESAEDAEEGESSASDDASADDAGSDDAGSDDAGPDKTANDEAGGEPDGDESPSERLAMIRVLRTEEAVQTSDRMSHETFAIAEEFDRILLELDNNNVSFFDEFERRINEGISDPLKRIADKDFPLLDDRLDQLRRVLEDDQRRPPAVLAARQQVDVILREMDGILQNMLELREFNELLANLRKILEAQKQVSQLTEEQREKIKKQLAEELKKGLLD